jgi:2,4-diaminopentanoate dehydrogenase
MTVRERLKVIVWGPGGVGRACLKILYDRPEFEIVGVLAHSPSKDGVDVGEFLGRPHIGVRMSTDREAVFALDADVVLYTGAPPIDHAAMDEDMIQLLASGKNVINSTAYFYPHHHGPEYVARLEAACRKGGTSLHGSGEQPGFFFERIAAALTTMCSELDMLSMEETVNVSGSSLQTMGVFGVGQPLEVALAPNPVRDQLLLTVYSEQLSMVGKSLFGKPVETVMDVECIVADETITLPTGTIEKGNVRDLVFTYTGSVDGTPRLKTTVRWLFSCDERWIIAVEGKPVSISADISAFASLLDKSHARLGDDTALTSYITAMPMIQAIPVVCAAEPGLVYPSLFSHYMTDFRGLSATGSILGVPGTPGRSC